MDKLFGKKDVKGKIYNATKTIKVLGNLAIKISFYF
jgi:hypothetical protein